MKKLPVKTKAFLCQLREQNTGKLLDEFVEVGVYRTRTLYGKPTYFNRLSPPKGRFFTGKHKQSRDSGPFYSIKLCFNAGMDRLSRHMKTTAFLEYTYDAGALNLRIVETQEGYVASVRSDDTPRYWTDEKTIIAEAVFEAEDYIYENFTNVKCIRNEASGGLHEHD